MTGGGARLSRRLRINQLYWRLRALGENLRWHLYRCRAPGQIRQQVQACQREGREISLQVGAGGKALPGWINTDYAYYPNCVFLDITRPLPFADGQLSLIVAEHVIANVPKQGGMAFLRECHRCLRPAGVLRLSTPNLTALSSLLLTGEPAEILGALLERHRRLYRPRAAAVSPCDLVNDLHRMWGHRYLYTEEELYRQLRRAGFSQIEKLMYGYSRHPRLEGIDQHQAGPEMAYINLIVDVTR